VNIPTIRPASESAGDVAWVVTLLGDPSGRCRVLHPHGVSPLPDRHQPVALTGTHCVDGAVISWAFGYADPDTVAPTVWFVSHGGLRQRPALVRRLTATLWAAQLPGRWCRVRVA
jgi:hypothetical protein